MSTNCSAGCATQDHATYGECIRSKSLRVAYCQSAAGLDATRQKRWDSELDEYRAAVRQGIEPESTALRDTRAAVAWSNANGTAYSEEKATEVVATRYLEKVA